MTSCTSGKKEDDIVQKREDDEDEQEISIVPDHQLSEDNYKTILPYRPSQSRGVIVDQVANRLDIDEIESGLRRHSKEIFDPKTYYFEEGQYLSEDTVYKWLGRQLTDDQLEKELDKQIEQLEEAEMTVNDEVISDIEKDLQLGLNPPLEDLDDLSEKEQKKLHEKNPRYISHVLEHNFLERNDDDTVELAGLSIAIAMKSVYQFETESKGPYFHDIPKKEMLKKGKEASETILKRIRSMEELQDIPIMIALYREEEQSSPVPGNFVAKTVVSKNETEIEDWETIDEEYVLFPSDKGKKDYYEDHELISSFGDKVAEYFPNYTGVVGEGFYIDGELQKMSIDIPIEFYGSGEVVGFTQYAYGLVEEMFSPNYDLDIQIKSSDQLESLIYRDVDDEELHVHIAH